MLGYNDNHGVYVRLGFVHSIASLNETGFPLSVLLFRVLNRTSFLLSDEFQKSVYNLWIEMFSRLLLDIFQSLFF